MTADPVADARPSRRGVPLIDGIEKVTGRARYTADLDHAGPLSELYFAARQATQKSCDWTFPGRERSRESLRSLRATIARTLTVSYRLP